ncbi:MAG: hypothetical protein ACHQ1D_00920 [Nitrososphaerales archaeon]
MLIIKSKNKKVTAKIRKKMSKGYSPDNYVKVVNPMDANDLALLFEDLELLLNAPIDKAFRTFKERKNKDNPFF